MNNKLFSVLIGGFVIMLLGFNADAITNQIVTPDLEQCNGNEYLLGFDHTGKLICNEFSTTESTQTEENSNSFNLEQIEKLGLFADKMTIDDTHIYLDSRFSGFGEQLRPSGSQYQIYCDKIGTQKDVNPQNCTIWITSHDNKTSAIIFSKDYDGVWKKVGALTEATNHKELRMYVYNDKGSVDLTGMTRFTQDGMLTWCVPSNSWINHSYESCTPNS